MSEGDNNETAKQDEFSTDSIFETGRIKRSKKYRASEWRKLNEITTEILSKKPSRKRPRSIKINWSWRLFIKIIWQLLLVLIFPFLLFFTIGGFAMLSMGPEAVYELTQDPTDTGPMDNYKDTFLFVLLNTGCVLALIFWFYRSARKAKARAIKSKLPIRITRYISSLMTLIITGGLFTTMLLMATNREGNPELVIAVKLCIVTSFSLALYVSSEMREAKQINRDLKSKRARS